MVIGQIADYRRHLDNPVCAILLPSQERPDLIELASVEGMGLLWPGSLEGDEGTVSLS